MILFDAFSKMTSSFTLPTFEQMSAVNTSNFTLLQRRCSDNLRGHLEIMQLIINFFDTPALRDQFITVYSNYMAFKCVVRTSSATDRREYVEEIRFLLPADNLLFRVLEVENVFYARRSDRVQTFLEICVGFLERNLTINGIITELWEPIPLPLFEQLGCPNDYLTLCVHTGTIPGLMNERSEVDRLFENWRSRFIDEMYAPTHKHTVKISSEPFEITDENKDDKNECNICYASQSLYVCVDCKYPMCKECLKHVLKTTGKCPCCQREGAEFSVHVVHRGESFKELVDDLNFDLDDQQLIEIPCKFTPEQINEEVDDDLHGPHNTPNGPPNSDIQLNEPLNDPEDSSYDADDEPIGSIYDAPELIRAERALRHQRRFSPDHPRRMFTGAGAPQVTARIVIGQPLRTPPRPDQIVYRQPNQPYQPPHFEDNEDHQFDDVD